MKVSVTLMSEHGVQISERIYDTETDLCASKNARQDIVSFVLDQFGYDGADPQGGRLVWTVAP